jgi:hypothetical protein
MKVQQKHAMRRKEAGAPETSVETYVTICFRKAKERNQDIFIVASTEFNLHPKTLPAKASDLRKKKIRSGVDFGCMAVNMHAEDRGTFLDFTLKLR